jgi:8-oxo-dGTP pyrophosphatase MutT (NUDIX family)
MEENTQKISISYGIIAYTYLNNEIKFLMTLRRDTFCYECIIRGLYTKDVLEEYMSHITHTEKDRILKYDFDMLWKDLWVSPKRRLYRLEYKRAKDKYEDNRDIIIKYLSKLKIFDKELWEFPKGKIFNSEIPLHCALREFEEETNIKKENIIIVKKAGMFNDMFKGNDKRIYKSSYYLGLIHNGTNINFIYNKCPHNMRNDYVSDEVMSIEWLSYEQARDCCSPTKQSILDNVYKYLIGK